MGEVMIPTTPVAEPAIWVEVLSRLHHHDVAARYRFTDVPITIGRAYDNDVVIDDPHVAAHHLRITRGENGALVAEDLGSLNGLYVDRARKRSKEVTLDAGHELSIGATVLRVRTAVHEVPAETPMLRGLPYWPSAILCIVGVFALAALDLWLSETSEPKAIRYFTPLLILTVAVSVWTTAWSVLTRVFTGRARFGLHFLIVAAGLLGYSVYSQLAEMGAFAWSWTALANSSYVVAWLFLGGIVFAHLLVVNKARRPLKLVVALILVAAGIAMQTLKQSEYRSTYGQPALLGRLEPPALRLVSPQREQAFFTDSEAIRARLDKARLEEPTGGGEPQGEEDDE
ncbi:MAG TPA: FHA domain-containing protein [Rhodanobacteraceae bacterium]|nr:FHA domain-containing protein [Rhodanobacteraceae bacterium]